MKSPALPPAIERAAWEPWCVKAHSKQKKDRSTEHAGWRCSGGAEAEVLAASPQSTLRFIRVLSCYLAVFFGPWFFSEVGVPVSEKAGPCGHPKVVDLTVGQKLALSALEKGSIPGFLYRRKNTATSTTAVSSTLTTLVMSHEVWDNS